MNYISMFLKNRHRKKLVKEINNLKVQSARFLEKSNNAKISANEFISYVHLRQERAKYGDEAAIIWLSCYYLSDYLEKYRKYSESATIYYQHYKNLQNQIDFLNQELSKLDT